MRIIGLAAFFTSVYKDNEFSDIRCQANRRGPAAFNSHKVNARGISCCVSNLTRPLYILRLSE